MEENMYTVGKIINTQGINGEAKVYRITDFEDRFNIGNTVYALLNRETLPLEIDGYRIHKGFDILHFRGYDSINDTEPLKETTLAIPASQLTTLDEGEYYYHEIIGCDVWTTTNEKVGTITEILTPGANDVWVVEPAKGKDVLIPYIDDIVKRVDIAHKTVIIEAMEGLLD